MNALRTLPVFTGRVAKRFTTFFSMACECGYVLGVWWCSALKYLQPFPVFMLRFFFAFSHKVIACSHGGGVCVCE